MRNLEIWSETKMEQSENKMKKKQKTAIIFAPKRNWRLKLPSISLLSEMKQNGSEKLPSFSLRSKMEAKFFFALMRKNEMKRKQNEKEAKLQSEKG